MPKSKNGTIQPQHVLISKPSDMRADLSFRNGRDLIHHQSADSSQALAFVWLHWQAEQRSICRVGSESAHRDRIGHVETVLLKNHNRTGFAGVFLAPASVQICPRLTSRPNQRQR